MKNLWLLISAVVSWVTGMLCAWLAYFSPEAGGHGSSAPEVYFGFTSGALFIAAIGLVVLWFISVISDD